MDFFLIRRMRKGDEEAQEVFVRKYYNDILTYCYYHCPDRAYAQDLTQETFVHFFTKLSNYHHQAKAKNYLYTIAGNLCRDFYKKKKEISVEEIKLLSDQSAHQTADDGAVNKLLIEAALAKLPAELREVIILFYFQDLKMTAIAETLQIGLPLAKYRLKQAKTKLETLLLEEDQDET